MWAQKQALFTPIVWHDSHHLETTQSFHPFCLQEVASVLTESQAVPNKKKLFTTNSLSCDREPAQLRDSATRNHSCNSRRVATLVLICLGAWASLNVDCAEAGPITLANPPGTISFGQAQQDGFTTVIVDQLNLAIVPFLLNDNGVQRATDIKNSYNNLNAHQANQVQNKVLWPDDDLVPGIRIEHRDHTNAGDVLEVPNARKAEIQFFPGNGVLAGKVFKGSFSDGLGTNLNFNVVAAPDDTLNIVVLKARNAMMAQLGPGHPYTLEFDENTNLIRITLPFGGDNVQLSSSTDYDGGSYAMLDSTIPEPQTIVLSGIGLAGLLIARRRRLNKGAQSAA